MATYHATIVPRPRDEPPDPKTRPLSPRDVTADTEADALTQVDAFLAEAGYHAWRRVYERFGDADLASLITDNSGDWQVNVRLVLRPSVHIEPRAITTEIVRDGVIVGETYNYEGGAGEESFDVLLNGLVNGVLVATWMGGSPQASCRSAMPDRCRSQPCLDPRGSARPARAAGWPPMGATVERGGSGMARHGARGHSRGARGERREAGEVKRAI
jgi:hypothetical protein